MANLIDGLPDHLPQEVRDRILARRAEQAKAAQTPEPTRKKK
jgi:hypothetical protein